MDDGGRSEAGDQRNFTPGDEPPTDDDDFRENDTQMNFNEL